MKKAYIAMMVFLVMGLVACSSDELSVPTTETVAVIETTDISTETITEIEKDVELTNLPTETAGETTESTTAQTETKTAEQTEPPSEPTQAPEKPPKETKPATQETTPPKQTEPLATTEPPVQTEPPAETEPPEIIDMQALIDYGREYAANKYGYEVCIGLRDGYYPADDHLIHTMEDGYKAVRASVDCTTRMLLACPGVQIVKEIDGVLCRARIDIAIQEFGGGEYRIWVYYG